MATTHNKMLLDINEKPSDIITAVQNDTNSRYLDVLLYDNGTPIDLTGCEVKIFMNKPEKGGEIWNNGVITDAENGRCEFLLTTEALTHFGHLQVQISIWKDNVEILSSHIFEIIVTKSLLGNSSVEASNEYGTLVVLFQNLYEAHALMTTMVENIGVPAEVAAQYDLETMWQAWEFMVAYLKGDLTDKINEAIANASVQGVLDILGLTDDAGGSVTTGTAMAKLNSLLSRAPTAIKKVQRGTVNADAARTGGGTSPKLYESYTHIWYYDVIISAVSDISKCTVNVWAGGGATVPFTPILVSPTTLRVYVGASNGGDFIGSPIRTGFSWEVREYY